MCFENSASSSWFSSLSKKTAAEYSLTPAALERSTVIRHDHFSVFPGHSVLLRGNIYLKQCRRIRALPGRFFSPKLKIWKLKEIPVFHFLHSFIFLLMLSSLYFFSFDGLEAAFSRCEIKVRMWVIGPRIIGRVFINPVICILSKLQQRKCFE